MKRAFPLSSSSPPDSLSQAKFPHFSFHDLRFSRGLSLLRGLMSLWSEVFRYNYGLRSLFKQF